MAKRAAAASPAPEPLTSC